MYLNNIQYVGLVPIGVVMASGRKLQSNVGVDNAGLELKLVSAGVGGYIGLFYSKYRTQAPDIIVPIVDPSLPHIYRIPPGEIGPVRIPPVSDPQPDEPPRDPPRPKRPKIH